MELVQTLTSTFEAHDQKNDGSAEYSLALDLQHLLGYAKSDSFLNGFSKAKSACELSGLEVAHFADAGETVDFDFDIQRKSYLYSEVTIDTSTIDAPARTGYRNQHIRPLAVRPLDHPERRPTPWGFLFSGSRKTHIATPQRRSP